MVVKVGDISPYPGLPSSLFVKKKKERGFHAYYGVFLARLSNVNANIGGSSDVISNTIVAPLVLCRMGLPLDPYMDSLEHTLRICGKKEVKYINYRSRWNIFKRISIRHMFTSSS